MLPFTILTLMGIPSTTAYSPDTDQSVLAVLWYQKSAEMRALYYQAFNLAETRAKEYLGDPIPGKPPAVIFDIDETLLDNSPSEAVNIMEGKPYSDERWKNWTDKASARALPGSSELCNFLDRNGIEVFYVSNRHISETTATIENLKRCNFPLPDSSHLLLKSGSSSKQARRANIEKDFNILLLVGDNLGDFDRIFENRSENFGFKQVDSLRNLFGERFIILPNPMYGDWTKPLYGSQKNLSPEEMAAFRRGLLRND